MGEEGGLSSGRRSGTVWEGEKGMRAVGRGGEQGLEYATPSQFHVYMEPQAAVAIPDEAGSIHVQSSTQCIDMVHGAVADALGLPFNKVTASAPLSFPAPFCLPNPWGGDDSSSPLAPLFAPAISRCFDACSPSFAPTSGCSCE